MEHTDHIANQPKQLKKLAQEALAKAKRIEADKKAKGARFRRIDGKTWALRTQEEVRVPGTDGMPFSG